MFESLIQEAQAASDSSGEGELLIKNANPLRVRGGGALRALEWSEITARLGAARDLRRLMRRDSRLNIAGGAASFGDAAATYFQWTGSCEPDVNLAALAQGKASNGRDQNPDGDAATGDPRDD